MPVITVYGLPADTTEQALQELYRDCAVSVSNVEELKLTNGQVTFLFPKDMMMFELGKEIIIFVDGLFVKPERTDNVRARLAKILGMTVKQWFPAADVEVFVRSFDPAQGFWRSDKGVYGRVDLDESCN